MSRRTPPNTKLEKMDIKQEKDKDDKPDEDTAAAAMGGGGSGGGAGATGPQSGVASGGSLATTSSAAAAVTSTAGATALNASSGSNSGPPSPRVTLRLQPAAVRTPEKRVSTDSNRSGCDGNDDPYEFTVSKDEGARDDGSAGQSHDTSPEDGGDKRKIDDEDEDGEHAKKKKRKEEPKEQSGIIGKGNSRGGEKSAKLTARSNMLNCHSGSSFNIMNKSSSSLSGGSNMNCPSSSFSSPTSSAAMSSGGSANTSLCSSGSSNNTSTVLGSESSRKSPQTLPTNSPKASIKQEKCEDSNEDDSSRHDGPTAGPKVPPLKIVLSACGGGSTGSSNSSNSQETEQSGPQSGKSSSSRHLPYVVPAAMTDKEDTGCYNAVTATAASFPSNSGIAASAPISAAAATAENIKEAGSQIKEEPLSPGAEKGAATRITRSQRGTGSADETTAAGTMWQNLMVFNSSKMKMEVKTEEMSLSSAAMAGSSGVSSTDADQLLPRKRKMNIKEEDHEQLELSPSEQPPSNCYQMFLKIRTQIDDRRKLLFPVQPKPPQGFKDYLMNRGTYVLAGNPSSHHSVPMMSVPQTLSQPLKDLFSTQEQERYRLRLQHQIERERLVLSVEQEILRVHGRAARALANQVLPFSACTMLRDQEVYNISTPEQEEKHRNARSRYNGRLFLSWLQDVDDKWEKIKESMVLRQQNEAESLNAVHRMDWEWKLKELGLCDNKSKPVIEELHVPMVAVSDFDLLPA